MNMSHKANQHLKFAAKVLARCLTVVACMALSFVTSPVSLAMNGVYDEDFFSANNILFYNPDDSSCIGTTGTDSVSTAPGGKIATYDINAVKSFAASPVNSAWGIADSSAEQWFLKQAGAQAVINKFGLTASTIGKITAAVKAAGVSPAFFYAYTVNEGGGAGGFINHYGSDASGGGVGNATRDAQYLVSQSQNTSGKPATGGGEPADMPTAEAQAILSALPAGSVGVVYIQATSAVTAELEDLSGKTGAWSNAFGKPLTGVMSAIVQMGGDLTQSGASSDCAGAVAGSGMAKGLSWAKFIAKNDGYGYDQPGRTTGWIKYKADPSCSSNCGSFDCSSFVSAILTEAGYFSTNPNFSTDSESSALEGAGFKKIASSAATSAGLQPGDILIKKIQTSQGYEGHTEIYLGDDQLAGASINEKGGTAYGAVGDQKGNEILIHAFYNGSWTEVWRATK